MRDLGDCGEAWRWFANVMNNNGMHDGHAACFISRRNRGIPVDTEACRVQCKATVMSVVNEYILVVAMIVSLTRRVSADRTTALSLRDSTKISPEGHTV
jgi:hypothetical protein